MVEASTPNIMLVDSSGKLEEELRPELEADDYSCTVVQSGTECLDSIDEREPAGIVSEYDLNDLDGIRLVRSIRVSNSGLPFILYAKTGSESVAGEAIAAGVSGYVRPEDGVSTILSRLEDCLERERPWIDAESQERYRHLINVSPAPINLFDESGESIWCNEAVLDLLNLETRDEIIGHSIFEFIHPDDHERAQEELGDVIEEKEPHGPTQMDLVTSDGDIRHTQISTAIGRFHGADIGQAVVIDITQLRETQDTLLEEQQFINDALNALQDVFYVIDENGNILRWNQTAKEVTGYDDDDFESLNVSDLFGGEDRGQVFQSISTVIERGQAIVEAELQRKDGTTIPFEFRGVKLPNREEDKPDRIVGIGRDITERKERTRQLELVERWLRHNIRNDMNVIRGIADIIKKGKRDDTEKLGQEILQQSDHLVSQAERGRKLVDLIIDPPKRESMEIDNLIDPIVKEVKKQHQQADLRLNQRGDITVEAIPEIEEALSEILTNAIEHNPSEDAEVILDIEQSGGEGVIQIRDNGPGIPKQDRESINMSSEVSQLYHGSDIGLVFAYWVTRLSGGDLKIVDTGPGGTTVEISLPLG